MGSAAHLPGMDIGTTLGATRCGAEWPWLGRTPWQRHGAGTGPLPAFEHYTLREITISKVDRFLKAQANISYNRAKQAKVALSLVVGLALRW